MLTDFVWRCIQVHWAALWVRIRRQIWGKSIWGKHWILPDHSRRRRWDGHPIQLSLQVITKTIGDGHGLQSILYVPTPLFKDQSPRTLVSDPDYDLKLPRTPSLAPEKRYASSSITTSNDKSSESCGLTEVLHVSGGGFFFVFLKSHFWILQWHKIPLYGEPNFGPFCWCNGGGGY